MLVFWLEWLSVDRPGAPPVPGCLHAKLKSFVWNEQFFTAGRSRTILRDAQRPRPCIGFWLAGSVRAVYWQIHP